MNYDETPNICVAVMNNNNNNINNDDNNGDDGIKVVVIIMTIRSYFVLSVLQMCLINALPRPESFEIERIGLGDDLNEAKITVNKINGAVVDSFGEIEANVRSVYDDALKNLENWPEDSPTMNEYAVRMRSDLNENLNSLIDMCESSRRHVDEAAHSVTNLQDVEEYQQRLMQLQQEIMTQIKPTAERFQDAASTIQMMSKSLSSNFKY